MFSKPSAPTAPVTFLLGLLLTGLVGCGPEEQFASRAPQSASESFAPAEEANGPMTEGAVTEGAEPGATADGDDASSVARTRKIIYDTVIGLVVEDYQEFEQRIVELVERHGGFVSHSETTRRFSDRQSGTWTIRVPVDRYTEFLTSVTSLGFAESRKENAQDVTEEFVDIEARIKNKRELERRIVAMLEERAGKLADVLEIERELSRVREEIERMEGRLRYLSDRTSLATVTINCREEKEYTPAEAPTFASRISRSWSASVGALVATGENLLIVLVAAAPWLVVLGVPIGLVLVGYRRSRRR